jgi:hypothetical protein
VSTAGVAGTELAARLGRNARPRAGSTQRLYIDLPEMQLFDPATTDLAVPA